MIEKKVGGQVNMLSDEEVVCIVGTKINFNSCDDIVFLSSWLASGTALLKTDDNVE